MRYIIGWQVSTSLCTDRAESFNGLYKTELIHQRGSWKNADSVESATLIYINWFNNRRLHGEISMLSPAEFETTHYHHTTPTITTGTHTTKSPWNSAGFRVPEVVGR